MGEEDALGGGGYFGQESSIAQRTAGPQGADDFVRALAELVVGEALDLETAGREVAVAGAVGREGGAVGVVCVGVELDHESLGAPEEVHGVGADADVGLGAGDPVLVEQAKEGPLQP